MQNPFTGAEAPGMSQMADPLGFIKKLWGSMQVPGMVAPPMSLDELDKKIQDLKTVESWLNVNMNMLRGTIQTLEVQRATLAALQSLGDSFVQHTREAQQAAAETAAAASAGAAFSNAGWPMSAASDKNAEAASESSNEVSPAAAAKAADAANAADGTHAADTAASRETSTAEESANAFSNPAVWWNLLQDQFKQAVSKAMQAESVSSESSAAEAQPEAIKKSPSVKPAVKPASTKSANTARPAAGKTAARAKVSKASSAKPATAAKKASTAAPKKTQSRSAASTQIKTRVPLKTKKQSVK